VVTNFQELSNQIIRSEVYDQEVLRSEISDQIDRLMAAQKMNNAELARKLKTSPAYVTKILRGNANFTLDSLVQIARALGCKYVPVFVPVNIWEQIEAIHLSATTTIQNGPPVEAYTPALADEDAA
jgi:transcriptional regulator with XRE-family HTH domain